MLAGSAYWGDPDAPDSTDHCASGPAMFSAIWPPRLVRLPSARLAKSNCSRICASGLGP